mgnify:CR=1 FL=1
MAESLTGVADGQEGVTHPTPAGTVPTNVGEPALKVPIGRAEGDLLNGLVEDEALGVVIYESDAVSGHVEGPTDGAAALSFQSVHGCLTHLQKIIEFYYIHVSLKKDE